MRALNRDSGKEVAHNLSVAGTLWSRTRGLLWRPALSSGEGLLIRPCKGVHTFLMRYPIDVIFLNRQNRVIHTVPNLRPQRVTRVLLRSQTVLELPAGTVMASGTAAGNEIVFE